MKLNSELQLDAESILSQFQTIDNFVNIQNLDASLLNYHNHSANKSIVKSMINFIKYQVKMNKSMVESRVESIKYFNDQIQDMKMLWMRKMELFETMEQKIEKKSRQTQEKIADQFAQMTKVQSALYEQTVNKKLTRVSEQNEYIFDQILKIKKQIYFLSRQSQNFSIQPQNQPNVQKCQLEQEHFLMKYNWIFQSIDWSKKIVREDNTIIALENDIQILGTKYILDNTDAWIKIKRLTGELLFGIYNAEKCSQKYIFYRSSVQQGAIHNEFSKNEQMIKFVPVREGDIIQITADTPGRKFTWNIKNFFIKKKEKKTIDVSEYACSKWCFFICFEKKGDSVILYK